MHFPLEGPENFLFFNPILTQNLGHLQIFVIHMSFLTVFLSLV